MSIAVNPDEQSRGVGKELVKGFLEEAKKRGLHQVDLTTDAIGNEAVNHFYQSLGFELERTYTTPDGRVMNEYLFNLS
jgi:ribosomal protein S18 acetylase RimI-like enzyme